MTNSSDKLLDQNISKYVFTSLGEETPEVADESKTSLPVGNIQSDHKTEESADNTEATNAPSANELDDIKQLSYTQGYNAAKEEARQTQESANSQITEILNDINTNLAIFFSEQEQKEQQLFVTAKEVIINIAKRIAGKALETHLDEHLIGKIDQAVTLLKNHNHLSIICNDQLNDEMKEKLSNLIKNSQIADKINIIYENNVKQGEFIVKWEDGHIEYKNNLIDQIDKIFSE